MSKLPDPAVIEIVEKTDSTSTGGADDIIVPNEIRINGHPVLAADVPVKVHAMEIPSREPVLVTLTLFAKRITVSTERPPAEPADSTP